MSEPIPQSLYTALRVSRGFQRVMVIVWPVMFVLVVLGLATGRFDDGGLATGLVMALGLLALGVFSVFRLRNLDRRLRDAVVED